MGLSISLEERERGFINFCERSLYFSNEFGEGDYPQSLRWKREIMAHKRVKFNYPSNHEIFSLFLWREEVRIIGM